LRFSMFETPLRLEFEEVIAGYGSVSADGAPPAKCAYWRMTRKKYGPVEPWRVEMGFNPESRDALALLQKDRPGEFTLTGKTDYGDDVQVGGIRFAGWEMFSGVLHGRAYGASVGPTSLGEQPEQQWGEVRLSQTPLARPQTPVFAPSHTGEIFGGSDAEKLPPLEFPCRVGTFGLQQHFGFENVDIGERPAKTRVPEAVLSLSLSPYVSDLGLVLDTVEEDLADALRVLTILSRVPVFWSSIKIQTKLPSGWRYTTRYATPLTSSERRVPVPMLDAKLLPPDVLAKILEAFRTSPYKDVIKTSAGPLAGFFDEGYIELGVMNAFMALEALVQGVDEIDGTGLTVPPHVFKELDKSLRAMIRQESKTLGISSAERAAIYDKLGELARGAIVPRTLACLDRFGVRTNDLWPPGTDLRRALMDAFRIRNAITHRGHIGDVDSAHDAGLRVHALAERLAYAMLAGDESWVHWQAYDHVYAINGHYPPRTPRRKPRSGVSRDLENPAT
jgi:hypothetical protein